MPILIFFLLLLFVPLAEIAGFIAIGERIGIASTIILTVLTAIAGSLLLRIQGIGIVRKFRASVDRGEPPVQEVMEGLMIFAAGVCLLIPGFFTDAVGLLLFVPPLRFLLARAITRQMEVRAYPAGRDHIIEGRYTVVGDDEDEDDDGPQDGPRRLN